MSLMDGFSAKTGTLTAVNRRSTASHQDLIDPRRGGLAVREAAALSS
jgi:hypothetical protein